jgi:RND family efflux transporter MFP subunit
MKYPMLHSTKSENQRGDAGRAGPERAAPPARRRLPRSLQLPATPFFVPTLEVRFMTEKHATANDAKKTPSGRRVLLTLGIIAVAAVVAAKTGISSRARSVQEVARWTDAQAIPTVAIVRPKAVSGQNELDLPGNIEAYYTGSIFARASGYVKKWCKDIGAHVKQGEILALIDTPDLDQQLAQARADLQTALANQRLSKVTADRWVALAVHNAVSQQAKDEKVGDLQAKTATVDASQANVDRLKSLQLFNQLAAPFDGVITSRGVDVGDLVAAGSNSGKPLYTVADIHRVRVYVNVPQAFLAGLKPGITASLMMPQYPSEKFPAKLATMSNAVAQDSRSELVELHADNADGKLLPGSFADVRFHIDASQHVLHIPATALFFGPGGIELALLRSDGKVKLTKVQLGRNLGRDVEVLSGLSPDASVIDSPPESLTTGQAVRVAERQDADVRRE